MFENGLWIIVLEMFAAIGMGVFIIWWTWPRKSPGPRKEATDDKRDVK